MICKQFLPTGSYPTIISCDFQPSLYRCQNHPSDCLGAAPGPHATDEHFWFRQWRLKAVLKLHHHQHKPRELLWKHIKIDYVFGKYIKIFKHIYINHLCIYVYIFIYRERERFGGQTLHFWDFESCSQMIRVPSGKKEALCFWEVYCFIFRHDFKCLLRSKRHSLVLGFQGNRPLKSGKSLIRETGHWNSHCSMNR